MSNEKEQRKVEAREEDHTAETPQTEFSEKATTRESQPSSGGNESKDGQQQSSASSSSDKEKKPSGGFDSTPLPDCPRGYTVKITIHRATNLPVADLNGFSSDPYCLSQINCDTPNRHKEDPNLRWRTATVRKSTEPEWNEEWIVANIPASGFKLKVRVYDEDAADADDLLGKVHVTIPAIDDNWEGLKNEQIKLHIHDGSYRAYAFHAITACMRKNKQFRGYMYISMELLGRTEEDGQHGRVYTVGPCKWTRHFSPMLGRLVNIKEPDEEDQPDLPERHISRTSAGQKQKKFQRYNFQANQIQLQGPVPPELYHRFVEFKPWVGRMFTSKGISGILMGKALRHQHARVYNYSRDTVTGQFDAPCKDMTISFLDSVHWDQGGRIFTYVLTLDALWRFTETGKEFGIDMLSKHTMHSDVSVYIAFSGEFFVRRLKHPKRPPPPEPVESSSQSHPPPHAENPTSPPDLISRNSKASSSTREEESPKDPQYYELVIDNDSGTYRPNASLLPILKKYLTTQLPGLHILTLDCNADAKRQQKMKAEQRERKRKAGDTMVFKQGRHGGGSERSSFSSSDEEEFEELRAAVLEDQQRGNNGEDGVVAATAKEGRRREREMVEKAKRELHLPGA
jgi:hypothetical protein